MLVRLSELMTETSPASGLEYAEQAGRLAKQYGYFEGEADALRQMGIIHSFWGDNHERLKYYARSTALSSKCDDAGRLIKSYTLIGRALLSSGEIDPDKIVAAGVFSEELQEDEILLFVVYRKKEMDRFAAIANQLITQINFRIGLKVSHVIPIKSIPKTASRKVQRFKLAQEYKNGSHREIIRRLENLLEEMDRNRDIQDPRTEIETELLRITREYISERTIGINDNFFELGVDSLVLTQIADRMERKYRGRVTVKDFFAYPNIEKLAEYLETSDSLSLPVLPLAQEYFREYYGDGGHFAYRYEIADRQYERIERISGGENLTPTGTMLALYLYLLSEITSKPMEARGKFFPASRRFIGPIGPICFLPGGTAEKDPSGSKSISNRQ